MPLLLALIIAALCAGCAHDPAPADPAILADPRGIALWHWHRDRRLSEDDARALAAMGCDQLAELRGEITLAADGSPLLAARGGQVIGAVAISVRCPIAFQPNGLL